MANLVLAESFQDIHPVKDIAARQIEVLGVDVENVLTDYGNPEVLKGVAEHMEELLTAGNGLRVVLITNQKDHTFLDEVTNQLPGGIDYVNPDAPAGLKKKPSPTMFQWVVNDMFTGIKPEHAAHVDDQLKAWWGASKAGYGTFFWTKPEGDHQHPGVRALRPVEFGFIRPILSFESSVMELARGDG